MTIFDLEKWNLRNGTKSMGPTKYHRYHPKPNIKEQKSESNMTSNTFADGKQ